MRRNVLDKMDNVNSLAIVRRCTTHCVKENHRLNFSHSLGSVPPREEGGARAPVPEQLLVIEPRRTTAHQLLSAQRMGSVVIKEFQEINLRNLWPLKHVYTKVLPI